MKIKLIKKIILLLFFFLNSDQSFSRDFDQFHMRLGLLNEKYSGVLEGTISISNTFDFEYEILSSQYSSFLIRSLLAYDFSVARLSYGYLGIAKRWYLSSLSVKYESQADRTWIEILPIWRFYLGFDFGIAQVVIKTFGPVLQVNSALMDVGAHLGGIYQLSEKLGIDAHVGMNTGFGFSSVTVSAVGYCFLLGLSFYI